MLFILIASKGRKSLKTTLDSIVKELQETDKVLVVLDGVKVERYEHKQIEYIEEGFLGYYGHPIRQKYQTYYLNEDSIKYVLNVDDDDVLHKGWRQEIYSEKPIKVYRYTQGKRRVVNHLESSKSIPITGNVLFHNEPKILKYPWKNEVGGDKHRVYEMIKDGNKVEYSKFKLFNKN